MFDDASYKASPQRIMFFIMSVGMITCILSPYFAYTSFTCYIFLYVICGWMILFQIRTNKFYLVSIVYKYHFFSLAESSNSIQFRKNKPYLKKRKINNIYIKTISILCWSHNSNKNIFLWTGSIWSFVVACEN